MSRPLFLLVTALAVVVACTTAASAGNEGRTAAWAGTPLPAVQDPDGKALYLKSCKQCHGVLGEPTKTAKREYEKIASLNDAEFMKTRTEKGIIEVVKKGKGEMKPFAEKLNHEEIEAVAKYVLTLVKKAG